MKDSFKKNQSMPEGHAASQRGRPRLATRARPRGRPARQQLAPNRALTLLLQQRLPQARRASAP
eukprot:2160224-Lingulodinium_polyedra.AAC.1